MFETGMFENQQSLASLKQPPQLHEDSNSDPSLSQYMNR